MKVMSNKLLRYLIKLDLCFLIHPNSLGMQSSTKVFEDIRFVSSDVIWGVNNASHTHTHFFYLLQEAGNPRAKDALKYVVLANMLALSDINPFAAREAKA